MAQCGCPQVGGVTREVRGIGTSWEREKKNHLFILKIISNGQNSFLKVKKYI